MARRADDLLSIFDPNRVESGDGRAASRKKSAARKAGTRGSSGKKRGFQGLYLSPRQVMLGGSAALLLLIVTFTLGLIIGRPGADGKGISLSKNVARKVMVQADFDLLNPHTQKPITRRAVFELLTKKFKVPARAVIDIRVEEQRMVIELGPFASHDDAEAYIEQWELPSSRINVGAPFRYHRIVGYQPRSR